MDGTRNTKEISSHTIGLAQPTIMIKYYQINKLMGISMTVDRNGIDIQLKLPVPVYFIGWKWSGDATAKP